MPALPPVTTKVRSTAGEVWIPGLTWWTRRGDALVVVDHLGDDEVEPLLGERGVELRVFGERAQPRDLVRSRSGSDGRQAVLGLQHADLLGELEALGEQVHERGVDVVDAQPDGGQLLGHGDGGRQP